MPELNMSPPPTGSEGCNQSHSSDFSAQALEREGIGRSGLSFPL